MSHHKSTSSLLPDFVVIYRGLDPARVVKATERLLDLGFGAFEVSLTSQDAIQSIGELANAFGDRALVGAGTVRSIDDVHAVRDAGGQMVLSPVVNEAVITTAKAAGLLTIPGAYTPTEAATAADLGADVVKLFPAAAGGVDYFRLLREPLPDIDFLVTGGVDATMARRFLDEGALSVGVGHRLLGGHLAEEDDWTGFARLSAAYLQSVRNGASR